MVPDEPYLEAARLALLDLLAREVSDPRVVEAFRAVPRHLFVPEPLRRHAWEDRALPLALGQTISQPSMVAIMLVALETRPSHRALEVGAGSGYAAAVLSRLVADVQGVELLPELAAMARRSLELAGIDNVTIHVGDGAAGLPALAPFDRILVSAGARAVPPALLEQLAPGGVIAIPVGGDGGQELLVGTKAADGSVSFRRGVACSFVPLV